MKQIRLFSILLLLLKKDVIKAIDLANELEVSTRTIYRDIDTLLASGVPIETIQGKQGGIMISNSYKIDNKFFSKNELENIYSALDNLHYSFTKQEYNSLINKITSLIPDNKQLKSAFSIDYTSWIGKRKDIGFYLKSIRKSIDDYHIISFKYNNLKGEESIRRVEPYQLFNKDNQWYLDAYCLTKNEYRVFKINRISQLNKSNQVFIKRDDFKHQDQLEINDITFIKVKIRIHKSVKYKILDFCNEEDITYDNDYIIADIPFTMDDYSYGLLLSFQDKCEILEPLEIREEIKNKLIKMLGFYQ